MVVFTALLVGTAAVVLYLVVWRDGGIPTPIPKPMAAWALGLGRGSAGLTLWRLFLVAVAVGGAFALVAGAGMVGSFVAALVLTTLLADTVRAWILDVWNANFFVAGGG
jgi:multisubunit Na+/H+ antiporter MnhB subunit